MNNWEYYDGGDPPVYRSGMKLYNEIDEVEDIYWEDLSDDDAYMMEAHLNEPNEWGGIKSDRQS
jgi:hypothetical protein